MSIALPVHPFLKHPRTGVPLAALGLRRNGDPVWPIIGGDGSEDDANDDTDDDAGDDAADDDKPDDDKDAGDDAKDDDEDDDKALGPKGEKALQASKQKARDEAKRRRATERENASLKAELDKLRKGAKPKPKSADGDEGDDDAVDPDEIRKEIQAELRAEAARERVWDKVETKAAKAFSDPVDAVRLLKADYDVDDLLDNGKPDVEAIAEALDELLEKKPYLGVAQRDGKRFKGTGDGGAKPPKPSRPKGLHEAVTRHYGAAQ